MIKASSGKNSLKQISYNRSRIRALFTRLCVLLISALIMQPSLAEEWKQSSQKNKIIATLKTESGTVEIGRFQHWLLRLTDQNSEPVFPAQIRIGGGMPDHGHGLPTQPQITEYLGDGTYLIEGVKLNMAGTWFIVFEISSSEISDQVQFELEIGH